MLVRLVASLAALCLSFNALAAKPVPLPMPIAQDLPVELVLSQQEVAIDVPNTASAMGAQFGLIGALIGSAVQNSQTKTAEKRVADLRNLLLDYRFNERMEQALRARLAGEGFSPNPQVAVMATPWDAASAKDSAKLPQDVLVLTPRYSMSTNLGGLTVRLQASYMHRERKSNGKVKETVRFSRPYTFQYNVTDYPSEDGAIDRRWLAMGPAGVSALIDNGIAQVTDMLAYDFSAAGRAESATKVKNDKIPFAGNIYRGRSLRATPDQVWVRSGNSWMQSVNGYTTLNAGKMTAAAPAPQPVVEAAPAVAPVAMPAAPAANDAAPAAAGADAGAGAGAGSR
ncbi:hypothetical protein ASD53_13275 [Lysobacter sp. Root559]|uniref:hypothetical protein n=1 Tax=Lysobacter sp. Root559 TaxID=1736559 RepID=UPI00070097EF|nr:hypothetical protein [Lysobacter sp. Root559]KQZ56509.1 hypothetical protein ASD53_13275 [Lysobacter sp. Root559]